MNFEFKFKLLYRDELINEEIKEDKNDPKEPSHYDYKYLSSKAGPLYVTKENDEVPLVDGQNDMTVKQKQQTIVKMSFERKKYGGVRMCQRCLKTKPDRCHHCSQCNLCILKMDHHCPWIANCVGFYNYKYFLNMLFYASLTC